MMLIGLCGFKRAGKDTVASGLVRHYEFTRVAFADALRREVAEIDGIPEVPDARKDEREPGGKSYRDALIWRGQLRRAEDPDYWVDQVDAKVRRLPAGSRVVVSDCRFPNEIAWVRRRGGLLVWVWREGIMSDGHITERDWSRSCDFPLHNDMSPPEELASWTLARCFSILGQTSFVA